MIFPPMDTSLSQIFTILLAITQLVECKPYVNNRRLSLGEQMNWRFGGWRPILPGNRNFHPDESSKSQSESSVSIARLAPKFKQSYHHHETEQIKIDDLNSFSLSNEKDIVSSGSNSGGSNIGNGANQKSISSSSSLSDPNQSNLNSGESYASSSIIKGPELTIPMPPYGPVLTINRVKGPYKVEAKPVKEAEMHAYEVIRKLKERGRDIGKDWSGSSSNVDGIHGMSIGYGKNGYLSTMKNRPMESNKRYVTVPVAIETDHDKVLTQNDIKDIEREVLKMIPEVEHGLVDGAVKEGAKVLEFGSELDTKPMSLHMKSGPMVISGHSPIIYESAPMSPVKPIKSRISSIFRPLLAKFRPPTRTPPAYSQTDPHNLNLIHLIAHQEQLPSIVSIDRLVRRPEIKGISKPMKGISMGGGNPSNYVQVSGSGSDGSYQQIQPQYQKISHQQSSYGGSSMNQATPMQQVQYKIIHPPLPGYSGNSYQPRQQKSQQQQQQQQQHHQHQHQQQKQNEYQSTGKGSTGYQIDYSPAGPQSNGGPIGPPKGQSESPAYQVIELSPGYDISSGGHHLMESPPQIVPLSNDGINDHIGGGGDVGPGPAYNHQSSLNDKRPEVTYATEKYTISSSPLPPSQQSYSVGSDGITYSEPPTNGYTFTTSNSVTYDSHSAMDIGYQVNHQQQQQQQQHQHQHQPQQVQVTQQDSVEQYQGEEKISSPNSDGYNGQSQQQQQNSGEQQYGSPIEGTYTAIESNEKYEQQQNHQQQSSSDYNDHVGQIQAPQGPEYRPQQVEVNDGHDDGSQSHGQNQGMIPSVQYAEAPKIELLDGQRPNFNDGQQKNDGNYGEKSNGGLATGEIDTKTLINLITNQIPALQNVLGGQNEADYSSHNGQKSSNEHIEAGYVIQNVATTPNDQQSAIYNSQEQTNYGNGGQVEGQRENYPLTGTISMPKFGDRIRDDVVYAKAEQYDDRFYQGHDPLSQGLYLESSNKKEVRVRSNQTYNATSQENPEEKFTFVKLDRNVSKSSDKETFGVRVNSTTSENGQSKSSDTQEPVQLYHAYYGSKDHVPPPGYVKLSVKEFREMFKDADIRVSNEESSAIVGTESTKRIDNSQTGEVTTKANESQASSSS
ncbi:uncharacterized protein LOC141850410 [Brevipalpus obovatus]|uniref:uncharacterized protein LOC141850410 n=1 Tax=Brevipalpus obovatus TaxID=246614 RepID=UPI003D9F1505